MALHLRAPYSAAAIPYLVATPHLFNPILGSLARNLPSHCDSLRGGTYETKPDYADGLISESPEPTSVAYIGLLNMLKSFLSHAGLLGAVACLSACAVQKTMVPTGGSRADGTVEMSYEVGEFEQAKIDLTQAAKDAARRCQAWGYSDAEPFGGQKSECQQRGGFGGCARTFVSMQFQCTGSSASK